MTVANVTSVGLSTPALLPVEETPQQLPEPFSGMSTGNFVNASKTAPLVPPMRIAEDLGSHGIHSTPQLRSAAVKSSHGWMQTFALPPAKFRIKQSPAVKPLGVVTKV